MSKDRKKCALVPLHGGRNPAIPNPLERVAAMLVEQFSSQYALDRNGVRRTATVFGLEISICVTVWNEIPC
jgi:hypothetical protein